MSFKARIAHVLGSQHPLGGVLLGLALAIGDILLTPPDGAGDVTGVAAPRFILLGLAFGIALGWLLVGALRLEGRNAWIAHGAIALAVLVGFGAAGTAGDLYSSDAVPDWRFMVLPFVAIAVAAMGAGIWVHDPPRAERLFLAGGVALALVGYAQEASLAWAIIMGVAITYLWLIPSFSTFTATTGLVLHGLAVLAAAQAQPSWFTWTPFPFLTFFPIYVLALYLRSRDATRRNAFWVGIVATGLTTLLGFTTLIGRIRDGVPVMDSLVMLGGGSLFLAAFLLLHFLDAAPQPAAVEA